MVSRNIEQMLIAADNHFCAAGESAGDEFVIVRVFANRAG